MDNGILLTQRCCQSGIQVSLQSPTIVGPPVERHSIVVHCSMLTAYKYSRDTTKSTDTQYKRSIHNGANWQDDGAIKDMMELGKSMNGANLPVFLLEVNEADPVFYLYF